MVILEDWLNYNKLKLNTDKSQWWSNAPPLYFGDRCLKLTDVYNYLGFHIDKNLSFSEHINLLCTKLSRCNGIIYSLRNYCSTDILRSIYFALGHSCILQHILLWGGATVHLQKRVQISQNNILRNILPKTLGTSDLYSDLNILHIRQVYIYNSLLFLYKWLRMNDYGMLNSEKNTVLFQHRYSSRGKSNLSLPFPRVEKHRQFVLYNAIKEWNELPVHLRNITSFTSFKANILKYVKESIRY